MDAEIAELRLFIDQVLPTAIPERYAELEGQIEAHEKACDQIAAKRESMQREMDEFRVEHARLTDDVVSLRDEAILQEIGVYNYRHPMESADDYKEALSSLRRDIKDCVKSDRAVSTTDSTWTVNESKSQGRKMIRDTSKLLLRAYNNEADTLVDKLRPFRLDAAVARLDKSRTAINRLGAQPMEIAISGPYHRLRVRELELAADWLAKKEAPRLSALMREEANSRPNANDRHQHLSRN